MNRYGATVEQPVVLHVVDTYLFITGSWIYSQMTGLTRYRPAVVAQRTENLDIFPLMDVYQCQPIVPRSRSVLGRAVNRAVESVLGLGNRKQARIAHRFNAVVIHAHFGPAGYRALPLKRVTGLPLVTAFYGADACAVPHNSPKWRRRYERLFAEGDLFLAEGAHMKKTLVSLGCPPEKVVVQHLGIDLRRIRLSPRRPAEDGTINVISVGTFREKKGLVYAVRAFAAVARERPNVRLVIVGDGRTRPELEVKAKVLQAIKEERVGDRVRITGYIPYEQFLSEMRNAHLCLGPSVVASDGDAEGGAPVCLIEMTASGLPVVATRHCDIPEVILDGQSGFLVPEHDVDALTERLFFLVDHPETWDAMAVSGRRHVEQNYNTRIQIPILESIYDRLCGSPNPALRSTGCIPPAEVEAFERLT